jgi:hypothetical protein
MGAKQSSIFKYNLTIPLSKLTKKKEALLLELPMT